MKKLLGVVLLTASLTIAGCFTTTPHEPAHPAPSTPLTAAKIAPPPPVMPDQVTAENAWASAKRLEAEMKEP